MSDMEYVSAETLDQIADVAIPRAIKFQKLAFRSYAGVMEKVSFEVGFPELAERFSFDSLMTRHDFDIDDEATPGQRDISDKHVQEILEGMRSSERPFLGTLTIALGREHVEVEVVQKLTPHQDLAKVTVYEDAPNAVPEDGQHRIAMAHKLWPQVRTATDGDELTIRQYLERTSVEVTLLLEDEKEVLSTIFVQMGSTKPISPSLIAVMDTSKLQNQLGQYLMRHAALFEDSVSYLSASASKRMAAKKGRDFRGVYGAAAVRSAAASMAGVGFRDRSPDLRERYLREVIEESAKMNGWSTKVALEKEGKQLVSLLDYAAKKIPGWKQFVGGTIDASIFKRDYVHSASVGLHVIANVVCAARVSGVDPRVAVDSLAELPWRRDALRDAKDEDGNKVKVHEFFEGDLVVTKFDTKKGSWVAGPAGATRSTYEPATQKILRYLAKDSTLKPLGELATFRAIGLESSGTRGRPRKSA